MTATENSPNKQRSSDRKGVGQKSPAHTSESLPGPDQLAITINVKTGQVVKIESVNGTGTHHQLSDDERAILANETGKATLEALIEQAFEAGIACGLGDTTREDDLLESDKDVNLRHLLLRSLIENSAAKRLMRRDILSRAFLKTLILNAVGPRAEARE
jgi:hypothetical protein